MTDTRLPHAQTTHDPATYDGDAPVPERKPTGPARYALAMARIGLGWVFLWAFLDKAFGLGFQTPAESAWINGGSPTTGYLAGQIEASGPAADALAAMSGQAWVDWLFMVGMGGVGIALVLGIGLRIAALGAICVMGPLWLSQLPLATNPFMDQHLMYVLVAIALAASNAGDTLGLGGAWSRTRLVKAIPVLR